ncbi:MAG: hypothetical protein NC201_00620 [Prevotella sp.]|nr:hypothetical protein [Bacteroides sp.]MCM1365731.1 hypothetical protein [Prevotella sp.]MCM1436401.1 hypothetical protein [Prevotella sp.]
MLFLSALVSSHSCKICGRDTLSYEHNICDQCLWSLPAHPQFGRKYPPVADRLVRLFPCFSANSLLIYQRNSIVANLIKEFKYYHSPLIAKRLGQRLAQQFSQSTLSLLIDAVIPLPIHFTKRMKRGYNQSEIIARPVAETLNVPMLKILSAVRPHKTQTHKSLRQRAELFPDNIFRLKKPQKIANKHILLIDDVITTGSTIAAAALEIHKKSPSSTISVLSLAATNI